MDIRIYFQKLRAAESSIADEFVVVVSLETPDGGKAGRMTEVDRRQAAHLLVKGRARLATTEETAEYYAQGERRRLEAERSSDARMQIAVLSDSEMRALKSSIRPQKG